MAEPADLTESPAADRESLRAALARVAPAGLIVTLLGFGGSIVIARRLGATAKTDAYYLAFSVATFGYVVLLAALRSGAIPKLTGLKHGNSSATFSQGCSELVTATLVAASVISLIVTVLMLAVMPLAASGSEELLDLTRKYMIELSPYAVTGGVEGALAAILAVNGMFAVPALLLGLETIFKIALLLLFPALGVQALIYGSLCGNFVVLLILWKLCSRQGVRLRFTAFRHSPLVRSTLVLAGPLAVGATVLALNPLIDRTAAAGLGSGNVTAFELGVRLYSAPASLLGAILIAPLAATWSARLNAEGWQSVRESYSRLMIAIVALVPPVVVIGFLIRQDAVAFVYQSHAYTEVAVSRTADVLGVLCFSLLPEVMIVPLATIFVIRGDSVFPMKVAFANAVLNAVLDLVLRIPFGVGGIAAGTALTYWILCAVYVAEAHRRWGSLGLRAAVRPAAVSGASCLTILVCCFPVLGLDHLGETAAEQIGALVLVVAIALIVHGLFLTIGRVVDVTRLIAKPTWRPLLITKR